MHWNASCEYRYLQIGTKYGRVEGAMRMLGLRVIGVVKVKNRVIRVYTSEMREREI